MKKIAVVISVVLLITVILTYLSTGSTEEQFRTCEILDASDVDSTDFSQYDSILVAANMLYKGDWVKEMMQGEQYREAWATPVRVPIVFMDTLFGGLKVIEEGGGMQTHSLEVEDDKGIRYSFRSISKDPSKLVPKVAENLGLENLIIDGVSAQHPYSAIAVAYLAEAAGILHTKPTVYFLPKQETLGKFNSKYGNRLYLLEYETEGEVNWTEFKNVVELLDTEDVQQWKSEGKSIYINRPALIRARLFDLIIGDWDRHAKQWGWAVEQKNDSLIAHPIAGDRDNAFFKQEGILPTIISNNALFPEMQSFEKDIDYIPGLVRPFDEYFLKNAPLEEFLTQAELLRDSLQEEIIYKAFEQWPRAIYNLNAEEIIANIVARRNGIVEYAKSFWEVLDKREMQIVVLKGSEELKLDEHLAKCFDCVER